MCTGRLVSRVCNPSHWVTCLLEEYTERTQLTLYNSLKSHGKLMMRLKIEQMVFVGDIAIYHWG